MYLALAIVLVFAGETFSIIAELLASKNMEAGAAFAFWTMFILIAAAGGCLVGGYMLGYEQLKNIWIVTAISVGSIVIVEPIITYLVFHQFPTAGATIGLGLGFAGIFASLLIR
ncbi:MAG: hypothetical protein P4L81_05100 [Candidatus Pacebacteria bacterium]|nr:hypothetical protein [Candidatus Paceibacterota bacterium]